MPGDVPNYLGKAFICPHCNANAQQSWASCTAQGHETSDTYLPGLTISTCFVCSGLAIWLEQPVRTDTWGASARMIYPAATVEGPKRNVDLPEAVARLYDEAATVVNLSPRSASALLRLALEALLEDLYPDKAGNLNSMIGAAVRDGLPERVQRTMDVMRFSGNQSVHEIHHDDTPQTAATLFGLLNIVAEQLITQPKQLDALYEGLPDGFKQQVDRRDGREAV
ncbi:DUF4145 domain-containing protein [Nocardioides sp. zg-579]|uniref:DUF4145 domain-containing protein n=1 Tax=Nocardioides marmotae TaxID=2663857 RepID=A0A6I3JE79_9ACTN|nr:DUF4145 domain-containing protein [Nocardioides marmotae]MCR6032854.1 DUF4145 domain-containing protein [Gordonia jinghuaiqii]MTB96504.1 DUF4145 domain-containing protein [Nocardioides marmotae]QKE01974.1 DUF4145 domain-containing protein [Nocardioides marmotae]